MLKKIYVYQSLHSAKQTWQNFRLSGFQDMQFCYTAANSLFQCLAERKIFQIWRVVRVDLVLLCRFQCTLLSDPSLQKLSVMFRFGYYLRYIFPVNFCSVLTYNSRHSGTTNGAEGITGFIFLQVFHVIFQWVNIS